MDDVAFRFGEYRLFPARRELWQADRLLNVQPKVLGTLIHLIEHRERAVGRDELIAAVWERVDLADNVLSQIVRRARQAVGDTAETQHSIRTVPMFGYRWVQGVELVRSLPTQLTCGQPARPPPAAGRRFLLAAVVAVVAIGASVLLASWSWQRDPLTTIRQALAAEELAVAREAFRHLSDEDRLRPVFRQEEAELALKEGRFDAALAGFTKLLADLRETGADPLRTGRAAHGVGRAEFVRRNYDAAVEHYRQGIALLSRADGEEATYWLGHAWAGLGGLHAVRHDFAEAERAFVHAAGIFERLGDPVLIGRLALNRGTTLVLRHRHADALPLLQLSADLAARAEDASVEAMARINLVGVLMALLRTDEALAMEPRLSELRGRIGDPAVLAHVELARAQALIANGRLTDAERVLRLEGGRPTPETPSLQASRDLAVAELAFARGAWEVGADHVRSALASSWYAPERTAAAQARWRLLAVKEAGGDVSGVVTLAANMEAQYRAKPELPQIALYAALARGEAAALQGDAAGAANEFTNAWRQASRHAVPFDLVQTADGYARFLLRQGEMAEASRLAEQIDGWAARNYEASLVQLAIHHGTGSERWQAALERTAALAGERIIPAALAEPPGLQEAVGNQVFIAGHLP